MENVKSPTRMIDHGKPQLVLQTDASNACWGTTDNNITTGGRVEDAVKRQA